MLNFSQALMEAKRRAQLSGRPLSQQESSGIAEGYANTAAERLAKAKLVANQEEQTRINQAALEQRKAESAAQAHAAERAMKSEERQARTSTAVTTTAVGAYAGFQYGATAGTAVSPGYGTLIGAGVGLIVGLVAGNSYLCTQTNKHSGLNKESVQLLNAFKKYAGKHHKGVLEFYLRVGPRIVAAIEETEGEDTKQFYNDLKTSMIEPVIEFTRKGELELAYQLYKETTVDLVALFVPELSDEFSTVIKIDEGLKEAA